MVDNMFGYFTIFKETTKEKTSLDEESIQCFSDLKQESDCFYWQLNTEKNRLEWDGNRDFDPKHHALEDISKLLKSRGIYPFY